MNEGEDEIKWLAERTGLDESKVEEGLEEGRRRRRAVVIELMEAGLVGRELLEMVMRLTGLPAKEARELIAAAPPEPNVESSE